MSDDADNYLKGNRFLANSADEVKVLYQSLKEYLDELSELAKFPDVYWEDPRIYKRALERTFQLIVDGVIRLSTLYLFESKPPEYSNWKIVAEFNGIIDSNVVNRFSGKYQYIYKRNRMVHDDAFSVDKDELEHEINSLFKATMYFLEELACYTPCPHCGSMNYFDPEDGNEISKEYNCPICHKIYSVVNVKPIILKSEHLSYLCSDEETQPWTSILAEARNYWCGWNGYEKDQKKAFAKYEEAASLGSPDAMKNLGLNYRYGWGCIKNLDKATDYFQKGAEAGAHACWAELAKLNSDNREQGTRYWDKYFKSKISGDDYWDIEYTLDFILEYIDQDPTFLDKYISKLNSLKSKIMKELVRKIDEEKKDEYRFELPKLEKALEWICRSFEFE